MIIPKPWKVEGLSGNPSEAFVIVAPGERTICWTANSLRPDGGEVVTEEDRGIARLIAAAPTLLSVLGCLEESASVGHADDCQGDCQLDRDLKSARALLEVLS